jgi:hypothetical protein
MGPYCALGEAGADDGIRTRDLRFTKPLLYQLSYVGTSDAKHCIPTQREQMHGVTGLRTSLQFHGAQCVRERYEGQPGSVRSVLAMARN